MSVKEIVLDVVAAIFIQFNPEAVEKLLEPNYVQHNPAVPTGAAPVLGFIPILKESGIKITQHRVITEGNMVVVHSTYENAQALGAPSLIAFDVFRVKNGKIAEHWDNFQAPIQKTVSGRSMVDGPTQIIDIEKTAENKAIVSGFVRDVLQGANPSKVTEYISTKTYHQHNPMVGDGLNGLGIALAAMAEAGQSMTYTKTPIIVAEGNFVFTASQGKLGNKPTAFFDLFRVEEGKIVEHWDTVSEIPTGMAHKNGKF